MTAASATPFPETRPEARLMLGGLAALPDPSGALWLPELETLLVADLHFEKGSSFAPKGVFLPPYDTARTLRDLAAVCTRYRPRQVIALGDSFHDRGAEARMGAADREKLATLCAATDWVWILGNHDPLPPAGLPGKPVTSFLLDGLILVHEPAVGGDWHLAGHLHPCARLAHEHRTLRRRCFVTDGTRMILPSFGAYTGGLNILDTAYDGLFDGPLRCFMAGRRACYEVPVRQLLPDRPSASRATSPIAASARSRAAKGR